MALDKVVDIVRGNGQYPHASNCRYDARLPLRGLRRYRSVWVSDFHLGSRGCRAARLLAFLSRVHCDTLYLVGDIVDAWALKHIWYWPASHTTVVQMLLALHREYGTRIVYVPGNHDELLRDGRTADDEMPSKHGRAWPQTA